MIVEEIIPIRIHEIVSNLVKFYFSRVEFKAVIIIAPNKFAIEFIKPQEMTSVTLR
jgi:hypothetical protein